MKGLVSAVFLAALTMSTAVAYGHMRHRHIHAARMHVRRVHNGADDNADNMSSAVGSAANNGNVSQLRALFDRGASANYMYENGGQPLIFAAVGAHVHAVRLLIAHGAYLYGENNGVETALDVAEGCKKFAANPVLRTKYDKIIAVLINAGAEAQDRAVLDAAHQGDTVRLQKLFAKDARVNFSLGNPLVLAVQGAHVAAVKALLKTGDAPFFRPDLNGATVLDDAEVRERRASDPTTRAKYEQIITLLKKVGR